MADQIENRSLHEILGKLFSFNLNTPEVILYLPATKNESEINKFTVTMNEFAKAIRAKGVKSVIRYSNYDEMQFLTPHAATQMLKNHTFQDDLLILKAPKSSIIYAGSCDIGPFFNNIHVDDESTSFKVAWNDKLDSQDVELNNFVHNLNTILYPYRSELDGMNIKWSYHHANVGILQRPLLFWGL